MIVRIPENVMLISYYLTDEQIKEYLNLVFNLEENIFKNAVDHFVIFDEDADDMIELSPKFEVLRPKVIKKECVRLSEKEESVFSKIYKFLKG